MRKILSRTAALLVSLTLSTAAYAQANFPSRTIRIVVPTAAGSGSDVSARFYGEQLGKILGQPVIVENRPGANGVIAAMAVKTAPADGYTLFLGTNTHIAINPILLKDVPYDAEKDFQPVIGLSRGMMVLLAGEHSPYKNIGDLVKASQGGKSLNAGSYTGGFQLAIAWFADVTQTAQVYVGYRGAGDLVTGLLGDQLDWGVSDLVATMPQIKSGKLRALAVAGSVRHPDLPEVPTAQESGYADYVNYTWGAFYVRAETPSEIAARLHEGMRQVMALPATAEFIKKFGQDLMPLPPEKMKKFQRAEIDRFNRIAQKSAIQPQ